MSKKQFKTESKRILDLMINSIYTNKEIFLRELISNASDAIDKLHFISLTDGNVDSNFKIEIKADKKERTLTVSDNGIGMTWVRLRSRVLLLLKTSRRKRLTLSDSSAWDFIRRSWWRRR